MSDLESTKGPESFQVPERPRSSLNIYKNLAYNILRDLDDELVRDKEIPSNVRNVTTIFSPHPVECNK